MTTDTPITAAAYADLVRAELTDLPPDDLMGSIQRIRIDASKPLALHGSLVS